MARRLGIEDAGYEEAPARCPSILAAPHQEPVTHRPTLPAPPATMKVRPQRGTDRPTITRRSNVINLSIKTDSKLCADCGRTGEARDAGGLRKGPWWIINNRDVQPMFTEALVANSRRGDMRDAPLALDTNSGGSG